MKLFKAIATLGVIGGIAYVIHRSYKTYKAETEGGISGEDIRLQRDIEEAKKTVAEHEAKIKASMMDDDEEEIEKNYDYEEEVIDEIAIIRPQVPLEEPEMDIEEGSTADDYFDEEEVIDELDDSLNTDGIVIKRKDEKLRHDPNSQAAIDQYKLMIMSDFESDPDLYDTLLKTWDEIFAPVNERDETIMLHIWDERCRFFGEDSIYSEGATMAELFIFYANKLSYDYDVDPIYALRSIFFNLGINDTSGETEISIIMRTVAHHDFVNDQNLYGIFGIPLNAYEKEIKKYPQVIIKSNDDVGFDMEYNVFCNLYGDAFEEDWYHSYRNRAEDASGVM